MDSRSDAGPRDGGGRLSVLILDSDSQLGEALALALRWEARVERAAGGVAGLIALVEQKPDLVIADALLPDVSSGELLHLLRILRPRLPIAILGDLEPQMEMRQDEATILFPKPVDLKRCLAWVHECLNQPPAEVPLQHLEIVRWVLEYIEQRFREGTPLATIAHSVGVSRSHLCRIFRRVTGQSLKSFLTRRRLRAAKVMLRNPQLMIQEVAASVGYRDVSHFDRVFRHLEGQSPSSYRRRCAQSAPIPGSYQNPLANPHLNASSPV
jgi:YesN/AraC family two-component response regulator